MSASIAVVVTCYDLGRTVEEALESVERQTRPAAEVVVVDDGSTDLYTRQVLAYLEARSVRIVRSENRGLAAARNLGVRHTSGDYLVHLDGDDVLEPSYFEKAAARLDAEPDLDYVSCAMRGFGAASYLWTPAPLNLVEAIATGGVVHASTMHRRRLWEAIGGYDEQLTGHVDLDFWTSALEQGFRGAVLEEPLLRYRVRAGSTYRRAIRRATHLALLDRFYRKHREAVTRHGPELIVGKEAFLLSQREHRGRLEARKASLEQELRRLDAEIGDLARALGERGAPRVDWGDLRRAGPISPVWGRDRGKPVNRVYVERFLEAHRADIRGRVLEVKDSGYTDVFGAGVTRRDVLDREPTNPRATMVADLTRAEAIPADTFDCFVLTQVLNVSYDVRAALAHACRILKPGGVLLCTVAAVDRVSPEDRGVDGDYWRFTEASMRELLAEVFPLAAFEVTTYGSLLTCAALLYGLGAEELSPEELEARDPWFPLIVAARAVKPGGAFPETGGPRRPASTIRAGGAPEESGAILAYHRIARLLPDAHGLCVAPEDFRAHLEHLGRHYRPVPLEELAAAAAAGRVPPRAVAVTLDDGYLDALSTASEILTGLGIPATFFVGTDRLEEEHESLWDTLERIFLAGSPIPPVLELEIAGQAVRRATATPEERLATRTWLTELTYPLSAGGRREVLGRLGGWSRLDLAPRPTHRFLTGPEVARLAARPGHQIGAHTTHHLVLPRQPVERQREEVSGCRARLEALLGRPVRTFCYPYGEHDAVTVGVVREAGLVAAVTCEEAPVHPGADPLRLPRLEVRGGGLEPFARRLGALLAAAGPVSPG